VFLGKVAAKQNLSGIVVKLARETGKKAKEETTVVTGVVTRGGKPMGGGRVGGWQKRREEMNRPNAKIHRGRTVPMGGHEFVQTLVNPDGSFALEKLKAGPWFGPWFLVYEEMTGSPTIVGPITVTSNDRKLTVNIAATEGGAIEGRVQNIPSPMAGQLWVVGFDTTILRREAIVSADGTFRLDDLPPGRIGLKVGHDAYIDPHVPRWESREKLDVTQFQKLAEPWQGAVVVNVEPGKTMRGVVVDFRPPGPLVEPSTETATLRR
jgi:hypothetical protein